jgi:hypothetical protein
MGKERVMKTSIRLAAGCLLALSSVSMGVMAKDKSEHGVYRPTLSTNPKSYLKKFELNVATTEEVIEYVGAPDKTLKVGESDFLTYNIDPDDTGVIEYTFEVKSGVVVNVTYLNSGNFFGVTQRESAKKLQSP